MPRADSCLHSARESGEFSGEDKMNRAWLAFQENAVSRRTHFAAFPLRSRCIARSTNVRACSGIRTRLVFPWKIGKIRREKNSYAGLALLIFTRGGSLVCGQAGERRLEPFSRNRGNRDCPLRAVTSRSAVAIMMY